MFEQEAGVLLPDEQETIMELKTDWEEIGEIRGEHRALTRIVVRLLRRRFGNLPSGFEARIDGLKDDALGYLSEALLEFATLADAEAWITNRSGS